MEGFYDIVENFVYSDTPAKPIRNTSNIIVFFEGFFMNLKQIRKQLGCDEYCEEEIIAELYNRNKEITLINGYFSIVIIDKKKRCIKAFTDRCCIGEIYYIFRNGQLFLSSGFKNILKYSKKLINEKALPKYFYGGGTGRRDTLIEDIKKIAQFYVLTFNGNLTISDDYLNHICNLQISNKIKEEDVMAFIDDSLNKYFDCLAMNYPEICNTLSGGVDSSILQAFLIKRDKRKSFSIDFEEYVGHKKYAEEVAEYLHTDHHSITLNVKNEFLNNIENGILITGKPYIYAGEAMFLKLYKHISEISSNSFIVNGQTADAAMGVSVSRPIQFFFNHSYIPSKLVNLILGQINNEWKTIGSEIRKKDLTPELVSKNKNTTETITNIKKYLNISNDLYESILELFDRFSGEKIDKISKLELYEGDLLRIPTTLSKIANSQGLRIVFPFANPVIVEFMLTVPHKLKAKHYRTKYLGKKVAEKYLPKKYIYRNKMSSQLPLKKIFQENEGFMEILKAIKRERYYRFDVDEMLRNNNTDMLFKLINFHIWKKKVVENRVSV